MYAYEMLAKNPNGLLKQRIAKKALSREYDRFQDKLQKLPNGSIHGLGTVPQPVQKTMPRIRVVLSERPTLLRKP